MNDTLLYIIMALGISIIINIMLKKLGISQIVGYIITGTVIVYSFNLREAGHSHELEMVGEFGIVFLMFSIGLEISLSKMGMMKKKIFVNGLMQVALTTFIVDVIAQYVFSIDATSSIIIALAFSLSSTAVVLSYLKSSKEIYTPYGQNSTGILIFQDIAVIPILIFIGFLTNEADESIDIILRDTLISAFFVISFLFVVGKRLVTWLLHFSASSELDELFMGSVLFIVLGASFFAYYMGFTYSLGAFVAGMIIAETKYHHKVESEIAPFKDILLGTFFIVVGMKIDLEMFVQNVDVIIGLFLVVLVLKTLIIFLLLRLSNNASISLKSAMALSQVGEFSFVIFALAFDGGLLEEKLVSLLVLIVIFSMIITPFLITKINVIVDRLIKSKDIQTDMSSLEGREDHIVVCGYGVVGKFVAKELDALGAPYIIVDNSSKHVQEALNNDMEAYLGDASKSTILGALNIEKAASIIVTLDNIDKKRLICEAVVDGARDANVVVKVVSLEEKEKLQDLNITVIVDGKVEVARVLVEGILSCPLKYS